MLDDRGKVLRCCSAAVEKGGKKLASRLEKNQQTNRSAN